MPQFTPFMPLGLPQGDLGLGLGIFKTKFTIKGLTNTTPNLGTPSINQPGIMPSNITQMQIHLPQASGLLQAPSIPTFSLK